MQNNGRSTKVRCTCGSLEGAGTFEAKGKYLVLESNFGVARVLLGLALPRRLAQRLLKNACEKESARQQAETTDVAGSAPGPIGAVGVSTPAPSALTLGAPAQRT